MTYHMIPLTRDDARILEWESLVGEIVHESEEIQRYVESRNYDAFNYSVANVRTCLDELQERMNRDREYAERMGLVK